MLAGILLAALNMRMATTAIGPLIGEIQADTGLSPTAAGALGSVPLICFALFSVFVPGLARRFGLERVILGAIAILATGILLRLPPGNLLLFLGTVLVGIAISGINVAIPAVAKTSFPERPKRISSLYIAVLSLGATVAAAAAIPLSDAGLGWRGSLAVWAVPALLAMIVWGMLARRRPDDRPEPPPRLGLRALMRSRLAVAVALFMATQSFTFYVILTWLTEALVDFGIGRSEAGLMFGVFQLSTTVPIIALSIWADSVRDDRVLTTLAGSFSIVGLAGLILFGADAAIFSVVVLGFGLGASFALAMSFFISRSADTAVAAELTGTGQSVSYMLAAGGPVLAGLLHELTGGWQPVLAAVIVVILIQSVIGFEAGRPATVGNRDLAPGD